MSKTVLEIKNLSKTFGKRKVIDDISLQVQEGEIYGFLGPNGSGKTTTIKMILRMIENDSGEIFVNGYNTKKDFEKAMENIGAIVENPDLYRYMTGRENLKLHARIRNVDNARIEEVLELVDLKERANEKVGKYSLGMKQRLGLALTLLHKPKVLILDEPTNGLDPAGIKKLRDILKEISHKEGVAVFVSSHILSEMQLMCDKVSVLDKGKIVTTQNIVNIEEEKTETVEIKVKDTEKTLQILKEQFEVDAIVKNNVITVETLTEKIPSIIKELAIKAVMPKEHTIEEIFFDATKGGKENE